ncbi:DNA polymerase III subunit alpha, partial [Myxococcota bacterium]|nr:DNA polymerase III subunit alpha [Myxococcota bacterium]
MSTEGMTNAGNSTEKQNKDFTHLHLHSQYSLLDGAIRLADLIPDIKAKGMSSVAVTDHGNMFGVLDFYKRATKGGIKPIIGVEAYIAGKKGRHDRTVRDSSHLVLLAKDNEGYKNLSYIISMGYLEGHYYVPRIDKELLREYSKGLIGLSACLGGVIAKPLRNEGKEAAAKEALEFKDIFAPGDFYLEIQDNGYKEQETLNRFIMDLARTYEMPLVATADAHYLKPEDSAAHEILMCIQQNRTLNEYRAKMHHSDKLYVKTPEEMWASFGESAPEALLNTTRIAEQCNVTIDMAGNDNRYYLPQYPVPEGEDTESYFQRLANEGMQWRISEADYDVDQELYQKRLDYELGVISTMGFAGYFLVVWDFINYSRDNDIPVGPGRGSGAGALVAYSLRITDLDPIPNDLIFERFLNPERISMPDFDIDFCMEGRDRVIDYVAERYGRNRVAQIITFGTMAAKAVIRDTGRVLGQPYGFVDRIAKLIPFEIGMTLEKALEQSEELAAMYHDDEEVAANIDLAMSLEGLARNAGKHAGGVVIAPNDLTDFTPLYCEDGGTNIVTQLDKDDVE